MDPIFQALNEKVIQSTVDVKTPKSSAAIEDSSFAKILGNTSPGQDAELSQFIDGLFGNMGKGPSMQAYQAQDINVDMNREYQVVQGPGSNAILDYLNDFNKSQFNIDQMIELATKGQLSQTECLAMQTLCYQHTTKVELTTKVLEQFTKLITQPLQMQI